MKSAVFKLLSVIALALMLLVMAGCTSDAKEDSEDNQNEKNEKVATVDGVLKNMFNAPNEDFQEAIKLRKDKPSDGEEEQFLSAYGQFMKDAFKPYVADEYYDEFIATYGTEFLKIANNNNYEMNVKFPEYEKTDSEDTIYNFTFQLQFRQDSSEQWEDRTVNGQANLNDNNKIKDMVFEDIQFLSELKQNDL